VASDSGKSIEIHGVRTSTQMQPASRRLTEDAAQTFLAGTPVHLGATGVVVWAGTGGAPVLDAILGFSEESASSLTTSGVPKTLTFGSVPNQPLAVNIPRGAPGNDGRIGVELANDETVFKGQIGAVLTPAVVGVSYGLTIDTDTHWYVDTSVTGANSSVRVVGIDAIDPRGVTFVVTRAAQQLLA